MSQNWREITQKNPHSNVKNKNAFEQLKKKLMHFPFLKKPELQQIFTNQKSDLFNRKRIRVLRRKQRKIRHRRYNEISRQRRVIWISRTVHLRHTSTHAENKDKIHLLKQNQ